MQFFAMILHTYMQVLNMFETLSNLVVICKDSTSAGTKLQWNYRKLTLATKVASKIMCKPAFKYINATNISDIK